MCGGDKIWDCWRFGTERPESDLVEIAEALHRANRSLENFARPHSSSRREFSRRGVTASVEKVSQNNGQYISLRVEEVPELGDGISSPAISGPCAL